MPRPAHRVGALALAFGLAAGCAFAHAPAPPDDAVLTRINREINLIPPHWDPSLQDQQWDCEDYAWAKLKALRALPELEHKYAPRVWAVDVPSYAKTKGGLHAVLVLNDGRVLDNLNSGLRTTDQLKQWPGYTFIRACDARDVAVCWP